jgi:hypothetical protein
MALVRRRWLRFTWYAAFIVVMASRTWRKWPDLMIDFGRELYTPWRLSEGAVLSRDVATLFGPLSQMLNGSLFRVFGVSFSTLIAANLVGIALITVMIDIFFERAASALAAFAAASVFIGVFAFGQYTTLGNYTYVAPYAHEAVHGVLLGVATITLLMAWFRSGRTPSLAAAGLCFGCIHLTKPEPALAVTVAAIAFFALAARQRRFTGRAPATFLALALAPVGVVFLALWQHLPAREALGTTLGAWTHVLSGSSGQEFYRSGAGLDDAAANLGRMVLVTIAVAGIVATAVLGDRLILLRRARFWTICMGTPAMGAILLLAPLAGPWAEIGRCLPLLCAAVLAMSVVRFWREPAGPSADRWLGLAAWGTLSLVLLLKIILNVRLYQYGFTLAMPATVLFIVSLVEIAPGELALQTDGAIARGFGLAFVVALLIVHVRWSDGLYEQKTYVLGTGGDAMVVLPPNESERTAAVALALERIDALTRADQTLAVFPEGVMLNYLSRRRAPTRFVSFMPPEWDAFGEGAILQSHSDARPDLILLVRRDVSEYGVGPFGRDSRYGAGFTRWVSGRYKVLETIGRDPDESRGYGIRVLQPVTLRLGK